MTGTSPPLSSSRVASPCNSVCKMDPRSGWCLGCLRTIDEIAAWSSLSEEARHAVLDRLDERRQVWFDRQTTPP